MKTTKIDEKFLKDSIIAKGELTLIKVVARKTLSKLFITAFKRKSQPMKLL